MKKVQVTDKTYGRLKRLKQFTDGHDADRPFHYPHTYDNLLRWMLNKLEPK